MNSLSTSYEGVYTYRRVNWSVSVPFGVRVYSHVPAVRDHCRPSDKVSWTRFTTLRQRPPDQDAGLRERIPGNKPGPMNVN